MGDIKLIENSELKNLQAENEHLKRLLSLVASVDEVDSTRALAIKHDTSYYTGKGIQLDIAQLLQNFVDRFYVDSVSLLLYNKKNHQFELFTNRNNCLQTKQLTYSLSADESVGLLSELSQKEYLLGNVDNKTRLWETALSQLGMLSWGVWPVVNKNLGKAILLFESYRFKREWIEYELHQVNQSVQLACFLLDDIVIKYQKSKEENYRQIILSTLNDICEDDILGGLKNIGEQFNFKAIAYYCCKQEGADPLIVWDETQNSLLFSQLQLYIKQNKDSVFLNQGEIINKELSYPFCIIPYKKYDEVEAFMVFFIHKDSTVDYSRLMPYLNVLCSQIFNIVRKVVISEQLQSDKLRYQDGIRRALGQKQFFQDVTNMSPIGVIVTDSKGHARFVNEYIQVLLGYHKVDIIDQQIQGLFLNNEHFFSEVIKDVIAGVSYSNEFELLKKDGQTVEMELMAIAVNYEQEMSCLLTLKDITKRRQKELQLSSSEKEFENLTQNSPDIIVRLDNKGKILYYNSALVNEFPFLNGSEIINKDFVTLQILDALMGATWQAKIDDVFAYGEKQSMDMGFSNEVSEIYFDWTLAPQMNNDGSIHSILAFGRNLTPRKIAEKELIIAKEKAEESDKLKSAFLANISHELRTPLNAIVGFSSLLKEGDVEAKDKSDYVDLILNSSDSLMTLINNVVDAAKLESGKISVSKEWVNVDQMLENIYHSYFKQVEETHHGRVKLCIEKPNTNDLLLRSDSIRLNQVFSHLISNAIKFTVKGFIEIGYTINTDEIVFYVKDTGIGISEGKQKVIFEPFRQENDDKTKCYGGTGIGLALCEKIVDALGGTIGLNSVSHVGSEFYFTLKIEETAANTVIQTAQQTNFTISEPILPKNDERKSKLILLVDENSCIHVDVRKQIEDTGLTLISARTSVGAIQLIKNRNDIHLVLTEIKDAEIHNNNLLNTIKLFNPKIPVIAFYSENFKGNPKQLFQLGFDKCIAKEVFKDELLEVISEVLEKEKA